MSRRVLIGQAADIPVGEARVVEADGKTLALFHVDGAFYALDNDCPHRGGPLGEGDLDGTVVVCPWHAWRWDVKTGANVNNPVVTMPCFPVSVDDGRVFVELP